MDFIKHSIEWCKGEIFEGRMILLFGFLFLVITFSFWKFSATQGERAFIIPMLLLSLLLLGTGISMNLNNQKRIASFKTTYNQNPKQFIKAEKERTEAFLKWYAPIRYIGTGIMLLGMLIFLLTVSPVLKSISLCIMITALGMFAIDYFSEERGKLYHANIVNALKK